MSLPFVDTLPAENLPIRDGVAFVKGHGTENDFVLIPDPDGVLVIGPEQVRALCDRRAGIGGDGVIRIVRFSDGRWFMDYRNADGSLAEMCGNGARVFARYLYDVGWVADGPFSFGTLGGLRTAERTADGRISIGMGPAIVSTPSTTDVRLTDGSQRHFDGVAVDVGNPHLVVVVDVPLADLDLTSAPSHDGELFPAGVNIEFVRRDGPDAVTMRVFERGVGETRSCGTGTVAVVAAHLAAADRDHGTVSVAVPGGSVTVALEPGSSTLTGPAVIVGTGYLDPDWWTTGR